MASKRLIERHVDSAAGVITKTWDYYNEGREAWEYADANAEAAGVAKFLYGPVPAKDAAESAGIHVIVEDATVTEPAPSPEENLTENPYVEPSTEEVVTHDMQVQEG